MGAGGVSQHVLGGREIWTGDVWTGGGDKGYIPTGKHSCLFSCKQWMRQNVLKKRFFQKNRSLFKEFLIRDTLGWYTNLFAIWSTVSWGGARPHPDMIMFLYLPTSTWPRFITCKKLMENSVRKKHTRFIKTKSSKFILFVFEKCYSNQKSHDNYQLEDGQKTSINDDIVPGILTFVAT